MALICRNASYTHLNSARGQPMISINHISYYCFLWGPENFDMRKNQLTRQGFMELNLMEATEKDGDPADLWVTLEAMGYNRMLELVEVSFTPTPQ